ncbi:MAG TPA: ABC transporter permease [Steroidobacter sp.]|uniref:ABC transporter permease n=1 Tax=Steroidobacter sp. TaxID=1978227 RepID=UPI002ED9B7AF
MNRRVANIYRLGVKELWSIARDPMLILLIVYAFTLSIYTSATAIPESLHKAAIAIVDEDRSPLSGRIASAFYPPHFQRPAMISLAELDPGLDAGEFTFGLVIPTGLQRDLLAGRAPEIQLNVDATRMSQAFVGSGAVQQIVNGEVTEFLQGYRRTTTAPVDLALRMRFNPTLERSWFMGVMTIIDRVTLVSLILTGAALIRERERGTIEHLLVMPVTPFEIMVSKVVSMGLVTIVATGLSLAIVVEALLQTPIQGSRLLFLFTGALTLASMTSMGILLATFSRTMPQFALLLMLIIVPLQLLSGGTTPRESMPELVQAAMLLAPTTHYVAASQAILYRGASLDIIWPQLTAITLIGAAFFWIAHARFRRTIAAMA